MTLGNFFELNFTPASYIHMSYHIVQLYNLFNSLSKCATKTAQTKNCHDLFTPMRTWLSCYVCVPKLGQPVNYII